MDGVSTATAASSGGGIMELNLGLDLSHYESCYAIFGSVSMMMEVSGFGVPWNISSPCLDHS